MAEVLTEGALCNALDAIATWQQAGADAAEVPLPPHVQDAMDAVRASHEALRAQVAEALQVDVEKLKRIAEHGLADAAVKVAAELSVVRVELRKVLSSRPRGCRERTVLEMLPAATAREAEEVAKP